MYTIVDIYGAPLRTLEVPAEMLALNIKEGERAVTAERPGDWWDGSAWQIKPEQPGKYHTWDWPTHTWIDARTDAQQAADAAQELSDARAAKLSEINRAAQAAAQALISGYPDFEQKTWDRQRAECEAWFGATDPAADLVPWCSACAAARGVELAEFMAKVKGNVDAFMAASAQIAGARQKLADMIESAASVDDLAGISWA